MSPIRPSEVNRFVREEGEYVTHLTGMRCFCRDSEGHFDPNCPEHDLLNSIYRDEREIIGLVTSVSQHKELLQAGLAFPGDCVFSPESTDVVSMGDKIIFPWDMPYGEGDVLTRGINPSDGLTYRPTKAIYCGDQDKVKYIEGKDFRFNGKTIEWSWAGKPANGTAPMMGKKYVIKYYAQIEWIVFDFPQERYSHGEDIGAKVLLRKLHLIGRGK